jgi:antitoxin FitA
MVAVQIRDVPDETRDALVRLAARKGQSLQAFLLDLVNDASRRERRLAILDEIDARQEGAPTTGLSAADLVRETRRERDEQLAERVWPSQVP